MSPLHDRVAAGATHFLSSVFSSPRINLQCSLIYARHAGRNLTTRHALPTFTPLHARSLSPLAVVASSRLPILVGFEVWAPDSHANVAERELHVHYFFFRLTKGGGRMENVIGGALKLKKPIGGITK